MNVLFIPYDGGKKPQKVSHGRGVTQNQHAAREYHRKEKLRKGMEKLQFMKASKNRNESTDSEPTTSSSEGQPSPQTLLGASRIDPFEALCKRDVPVYVHGG